ncbi:MFS transporter [Candidatus Bathyarchaeota archaeon]|nr:MFS transporter [Candidatus Bathyarchaeota archaeon]
MGVVAMVVTHALVHAAGNMRTTLIPFIKEDFELNNYQVGIISAIPPLAQAIFSIPAGWISDRSGAKNLVAFSVGLAALGALVAGFSYSPWMFVVSAALMTLTGTFYHPPAHSYTARLSKPKDRAKSMGLLNAGGTFGISIGPFSIYLLMTFFGLQWRQMYQFWVIPIILGIVLIMMTKTDPEGDTLNGNGHVHVQESHKVEADEPTSLLTREFLLFISSRGVRMFGMGMFSPFLSLYLTEVRGWSVTNIGLMLGISGILGLFFSPLGGHYASKFGEKRWVIGCFLVSGAAFLSAFYMPGIYAFMAMYLFYRLFGIMAMPGQASITARLSPPKQMGMGFALTFMPASITGIVAPIVAAWVLNNYGYLPIFIAATAVMYLSVILFALAVKD